MSLVIADRVRETTITSGTDAFVLQGAPVGFQTFLAAVRDGNSCEYCCVDQSGSNWEVAVGTYSAATNSISRLDTNVLSSSNGGSLVNFGSNIKDIFITVSASDISKLLTNYASKTVSTNTVLDANTEYQTGSNLVIANGVTLTIPASTTLIVHAYAASKTF